MSSDSATRFTDRVPYLGLVTWPPELIAEYAHKLAADHRPKRRWLIVGKKRCSACGTEPPCYAAAWALGQLPQPGQRDLQRENRREVIAALAAIAAGMVLFVAMVAWL